MDFSHSSELHVLDCRDRLSELPDSLILVILSLLPMTDVVATMLLSKRWKDLWTTVPCLEFRYWEPMFHNKLDKFQNFVCGALALWKGSNILKFRIHFCIDDYHITSDIADSWLLFAIEKQVEELRICAGSVKDSEYSLPQRLYSSSSIRKLSLDSCKLKIDKNVQWNQLKSLQMVGAKSLSEDAMSKVISGAPVLEDLILCFYEIEENLNIQSTSLKSLQIGNLAWSYIGTIFKAMLRIWAPNLSALEISGFFYGSLLLDVPSLTRAILCFKESCEGEIYANLPPIEMFNQVFQSIRHVETVTLSCLSIQFLLRMKKKKEMLSSFSNVKHLNLFPGCAIVMLDVLDMFPELNILRVQLDQDCYLELDKEARLCKVDVFPPYESKANFPVPFLLCLKTVEITWYMRDTSIIPAIEILLENADVLDKLVFRPLWYGGDRELLLSTATSSPTAEVIII